jgi:U3 small nucleolar ribonucleoprotein protein LCP5
LPKEPKKKKGRGQQGGEEGGYGGEDWMGLGEGADRVGRLVKGGKARAGGVLERSRKRGADGYGDGEREMGKRRR